ncbi:unnamed protein product [Boreogadus saida]
MAADASQSSATRRGSSAEINEVVVGGPVGLGPLHIPMWRLRDPTAMAAPRFTLLTIQRRIDRLPNLSTADGVVAPRCVNLPPGLGASPRRRESDVRPWERRF